MSTEQKKLKNILEAAMMAVGKPMSIEQIMKLFDDDKRPSINKIKDAINSLKLDCDERGVELKEVSSGYRYQAKQEYAEWLGRLWEEKPAKYSRAYLETLALIAYRQPVTRAEIEDVRGVGVSSSIVKTMLEREWIRVVGHRDVPGRPSLYATTKQFLDYFNMKSLDELPSLAEIKDLDDLNPELGLNEPGQLDEENDNKISLKDNDKLKEEVDVENVVIENEQDISAIATELSEVESYLADSEELMLKEIESKEIESKENESAINDPENSEKEDSTLDETEAFQQPLENDVTLETK